MNEKRFIQLINLQIDGEISPAELEELESEVDKKPRRRETYESYRRLQEASQVVYDRFGQALSETVDLKKYQILARNSSRCLWRGLLYSAGAIAAACVTVAAAIAVFQDAHWGPSGGGNASQAAFGAVEVLEPGALNKRTARFQLAANDRPEPFTFAGRPTGADRPQRRTGFLESVRPTAPRENFHPSAQAPVWEHGLHTDSATRVIRSHSAFDAPELVSFQFQR